MFTVYSGNDPGSTLVSNLFIDNYMEDANDAQLKVYLYLLRMMNAGLTTSISDMAVRFNHTERDIARSLRYWEDRGLIVLEYSSGGEITALHMVSPKNNTAMLTAGEAGEGMLHAKGVSFGSSFSYPKVPSLPRLQPMAIPVQNAAAQFASPAQNPGAAQLTAPAQNAAAQSAASAQFPSPAPFTAPAQSVTPAQDAAVSGERSSADAAAAAPAARQPDAASVEAFRSSAKRAQLLFVIEQYIGKPLAPSEVESVYYISEELHFSDALIDYLLQYCIDRGKKDFRYIEKVAVNWAEHGITTPKQAERAASSFGKNRRGYAGVKPSANPFNQFEQNQYDFDQLEKEILSN